MILMVVYRISNQRDPDFLGRSTDQSVVRGLGSGLHAGRSESTDPVPGSERSRYMHAYLPTYTPKYINSPIYSDRH